ncbi:MAG: redox-regulated ATPase YchF [Candidatus Curtissbacteria bacterium]|nr:redox-regulated ATPase YchF [Candidatus Curtissbacteria bacterium]
MNLSVGIVGLPNVGKSTLFNALLKKQVALSANYPFATIEPNVGVCEVPDERLEKLKEIVEKTEGLGPNFKIIPATVSFVDIAGLVKGAASGEGLGNQFLSHIREVDVIVFVLRDFKNEDIVRAGSENPKSDLEVLKTELMLKDLETINKRLETLNKELRSATVQDPRHQAAAVLQKAKGLIEQGKWLEENLDNDELEKIKDLQLLSTKKSIIVLNSDEEEIASSQAPRNDNEVRICAKTEEDLASLDAEEQKLYLAELGVAEPGLNILIKKAYETLGLITFLTAGPKEVRAWTTQKGALAPQAAGVIHTDFERGFIAAEVIDWEELVGCGGWKNAKDQGKIKTIGKTEAIKDGMVVEFRFSV